MIMMAGIRVAVQHPPTPRSSVLSPHLIHSAGMKGNRSVSLRPRPFSRWANVLLLLSAAAASGTLAAAPLALAFQAPRQRSRRPLASSPTVLRATAGADDEGGDAPSDDDEKGTEPAQHGWAGAAYSGLSNAWGYSSSVVDIRRRRRLERRRRRHRLKLQGKMEGGRPPTWAEKLVQMDAKTRIGPADAFVGNVRKGDVEGEAASPSPAAIAAFDDDEMDEDGYYNMLGGKRRGFLSRLLRQLVRVPYRALFGEYRRVAPGTLILVRHGESEWNANKTFTGMCFEFGNRRTFGGGLHGDGHLGDVILGNKIIVTLLTFSLDPFVIRVGRPGPEPAGVPGGRARGSPSAGGGIQGRRGFHVAAEAGDTERFPAAPGVRGGLPARVQKVV